MSQDIRIRHQRLTTAKMNWRNMQGHSDASKHEETFACHPHHPEKNGTVSQQAEHAMPEFRPDLTGPSMSTPTPTPTPASMTRPARSHMSQRIAYHLDLRAVEADPTLSIAPWNQPNGARQQRRWAPGAAAVPSGYPLPCSAAFSPGESLASLSTASRDRCPKWTATGSCSYSL